MTIQTERVEGSDLKVGDVLSGLWFAQGNRVRVLALTPYNGPLARLWGGPGKARIAAFDVGPGMTIEPTATFDRLVLS